jgi:hypothetical protein
VIIAIVLIAAVMVLTIAMIPTSNRSAAAVSA